MRVMSRRQSRGVAEVGLVDRLLERIDERDDVVEVLQDVVAWLQVGKVGDVRSVGGRHLSAEYARRSRCAGPDREVAERVPGRGSGRPRVLRYHVRRDAALVRVRRTVDCADYSRLRETPFTSTKLVKVPES